MNAILLAGACFGALAVTVIGQPSVPKTSDPIALAQLTPDRGAMTRDVTVNPKTGQTEETDVIGFVD